MISGITRGVQGIARAWTVSGETSVSVARNFTERDYAALVSNINELDESKAGTAEATTTTAGLMPAEDRASLKAATASATEETLVRRDANGRFKAAAPAAEDDVARKAEVDEVVTQLADIAINVSPFASIESAFAAAKTRGGGAVNFPVGDHVINETIVITDTPNLTVMASSLAKITTETEDLDFMFSFINCPGLRIVGIDFDNEDTGKSILRISECPDFIVDKCSFHNFKANTVDLYRHAIYVDNSPYGAITFNKFKNIGQTFGGSKEVSTQYRCISLNSGCDKTRIDNNWFDDVFQAFVIGEFSYWSSGVSYTNLSSRVLYEVGGQINHYQCIQSHTSSGAILPTNTSYWTLAYSDIAPNVDCFYNNNYHRNVRDNAVYFLEYVESIHIIGNKFYDMNDEPVVIVGRNAILEGNTFRNVKNRAIAIADVADIESVLIIGNIFDNAAGWLGTFVHFRNTTQTTSVHRLLIHDNTFRTAQDIGNASHFTLGKTTNLSIQGNVIDTVAESTQSIIRTWGNVVKGIIADNTILAASSGAYAYRDSAVSNIKYNGNRGNCGALVNGSTHIAQNVQLNTTASNVFALESNNKWGWGIAPPATAGAWLRGDVIFNLAPSSGGPVGWVCIASGSPGTWVAFGQVGVLASIAATPSFVGQIAVSGGNAF